MDNCGSMAATVDVGYNLTARAPGLTRELRTRMVLLEQQQAELTRLLTLPVLPLVEAAAQLASADFMDRRLTHACFCS